MMFNLRRQESIHNKDISYAIQQSGFRENCGLECTYIYYTNKEISSLSEGVERAIHLPDHLRF